MTLACQFTLSLGAPGEFGIIVVEQKDDPDFVGAIEPTCGDIVMQPELSPTGADSTAVGIVCGTRPASSR